MHIYPKHVNFFENFHIKCLLSSIQIHTNEFLKNNFSIFFTLFHNRFISIAKMKKKSQ